MGTPPSLSCSWRTVLTRPRRSRRENVHAPGAVALASRDERRRRLLRARPRRRRASSPDPSSRTPRRACSLAESAVLRRRVSPGTPSGAAAPPRRRSLVLAPLAHARAAGDLSANTSPARDVSSSSPRLARDFVAPAVASRFRGAAVSGLDRGVDDASAKQPVRARPLAPRVAEFPSARAHGALDPRSAPRDVPDAAAAHTAADVAPTSSPYTHYDARHARTPPPPPDEPPKDEEKRLYHFEVRGADAKRAMDPDKIRCMCHEVAVAAATRARNVHARAAVVEAGAASNSAPPDPDSLDDDFCVFSHTVMVRARARDDEKKPRDDADPSQTCDASRTSCASVRSLHTLSPDATRLSFPLPSARHPRREAQQAEFLGRHALVQLVRHGDASDSADDRGGRGRASGDGPSEPRSRRVRRRGRGRASRRPGIRRHQGDHHRARLSPARWRSGTCVGTRRWRR